MLNLVFAESALELVPREIRRMPAVVSDSRRRWKDPSEILLDRSLHHSAMNRLKDSEKRGRPDLVHEALLSVTGTPAYLEGMVRVFVHTYENVVLEIEDRTRIPKHYLRFRGLMEKVLVERPSVGLVKFRPGGMRELGRKVIDPDLVVGLSVQGKPKRLEEVAVEVRASKRPCVLIGGFPHGHFSSGTLGLVNELLRIDSRPLEAHVVAARLVYEVEKAEKQFND